MENLRKIHYNIKEFVGKYLGNKEGNIEFNIEIYTKVKGKEGCYERYTTRG